MQLRLLVAMTLGVLLIAFELVQRERTIAAAGWIAMFLSIVVFTFVDAIGGYVLAVGCSLGRAFSAPEGLAVSSDGASVYAAAFKSGAVDTFNRNADSGALIQKPRRRGCLTKRATPGCARGRALSGVSSVAVSPDGKHLYSGSFESNSVGVFRRVAKTNVSTLAPTPWDTVCRNCSSSRV